MQVRLLPARTLPPPARPGEAEPACGVTTPGRASVVSVASLPLMPETPLSVFFYLPGHRPLRLPAWTGQRRRCPPRRPSPSPPLSCPAVCRPHARGVWRVADTRDGASLSPSSLCRSLVDAQCGVSLRAPRGSAPFTFSSIVLVAGC